MRPIQIDVLFDGPPGPEGGRFIEAEDSGGRSIRAGEWIRRGDGLWALRLIVLLPPRLSPEGREAAARLGMPQELPPHTLHRCKICKTLWRQWAEQWPESPGSWSLADGEQRPGPCCDNAPMTAENMEPPPAVVFAAEGPRP